jgi:hypothetical protein
MHRGDELVEILDRYDNAGRWLVIHGHKHVPLLVNAAGNSAGTPIVLSAASLGGKLWHPIVTVTRNQFHMLEFHTDTVPGLPDLRGVCHSFMWGFGTGWSVSSDVQAGLPAACGFGITHDHRDLARRVDSNMTASGSEISDWADVVAAIPELTYQGPRDFNLFERRLEELRLQVVRDRNGRRRRVVRVDDDD